MNQFQIQLALSPAAYQLIMEGLAMLPLGRSKPLFDSLEAEAKKQAEAFDAAQKEPAEENDSPKE